MGYAIPEYPQQHAGTVIVLGSATCAPEDLRHAKRRHPWACIIGINDAAKICALDHLYSLHYEKLAYWKSYQAEHFGLTPLTHASEYIKKGQERHEHPAIDYWWVGTHGGGTSSWGAVRMAKMMGYGQIIMCGCPLDGSGYCVPHTPDNDSAASGLVPYDDPMLRRYRDRLIEYVREGEGEGVFSMSGFTRELLGAPT